MNKLLVVSCLKDDIFAPVSIEILKTKTADVVSAVKKQAELMGADVLYLLPEGETVDGLDAEVRYSTYSPVLGNSYAVAQVLAGNLPRPMIQDDYVAKYDGKEVAVLTPEVAYQIATGAKTRFVAINNGDKREIKEVEIGTAIGTLIDSSNAKAVLFGGLKGEFVPLSKLDETTIDEKMDTCVINVYPKGTCMVDTAVKLTQAAWECSCGKCVMCREGSLQFKTIVAEMTQAKAKMTDIDLIKEVGELVELGSYCPFGQNMPKPLLSAFDLFTSEFEEHIKKKACSEGVCYKAEAVYLILPDLCVGCGDCVDECPEDAIEGKAKFIHMIDQDMCEQCGKCVSACDEEAIVKWEEAKLPKLPKKLTKVGKF